MGREGERGGAERQKGGDREGGRDVRGIRAETGGRGTQRKKKGKIQGD